MHLADMVECVATAEKHRRSMDANAMRYLLFLRQYLLRKAQNLQTQAGITWREIAWAFHSDSQDILVDLVSRHYNGRILWSHAKESGIFMWMTDINALVSQYHQYIVVMLNRYLADTIRSHCKKRVYKNR